MQTAIAVAKISHLDFNKLGDLSNDELLRAIRARLAITAQAIEEVAALIREARRRNLSLAEFSTGIFRRIKQVADNQLHPELLVKFCDEPRKLDALIGVSLATQKRLAGGEVITVVETAQNESGFTVVEKPLRQLNAAQVAQVFDNGRVRSPYEQKRYRGGAAIKEAKRKHRAKGSTNAKKPPRVEADVAKGEIIIGGYRLKLIAFAGALKMLGYRLTRIE